MKNVESHSLEYFKIISKRGLNKIPKEKLKAAISSDKGMEQRFIRYLEILEGKVLLHISNNYTKNKVEKFECDILD